MCLMERTLDWTSGDMGLTFSFANYWLCNLRKKTLNFPGLSFITCKIAIIILVAAYFRVEDIRYIR